ncbi:N-acetylmuramoyl-L-alanine amidase-like domain-containing protein [Maribacter ulvicola]|uniref:DUF1460 domain-containing protein n=1 Tax=Maribacter ulvicola TaxID=228959 RepID=A0A1N6PUG4_9FLAO|nr:N-acetylmuramoyl-L-alanine amidase-like domain-containing protein [Maribacter ulvicola]SIQ07952.1 Protein of unknown function [Maribacter ulvicola]
MDYKSYLLILVVFFSTKAHAQQITCSPKDKAAVESKLIEIDEMYNGDFRGTMVSVGKTFMKTPYVAKTLEIGDTETLVVNLQGLDCTTFVENVLAFSLLLRQQEMSFDAYLKNLEIIRYKDGALEGYASRLHYFSEWIANNAEKGLLKDITAEIGGAEITKDIDFMSTHRDLYPFLADDSNFSKIKASENYLNNQAICVLAQDEIAKNEHLIKSGDIIALATSINGLDVTHTGIATREKDGRIHLLHASTGSMQVEVSKKPLAEYLKGIKSNIGIMVARPL